MNAESASPCNSRDDVEAYALRSRAAFARVCSSLERRLLKILAKASADTPELGARWLPPGACVTPVPGISPCVGRKVAGSGMRIEV